MKKTDIANYLSRHFSGLVTVDAWGEQAFFYNPHRLLPKGVYFATIKDKDGDNDTASHLNRPGFYRFNFSITPSTYDHLLGNRPERPVAGGIVNTGHDFTQVNTLLPHPVYAWMCWVCVLNPSHEFLEQLQPLLTESHARVIRRYAKRVKAEFPS